MKSFKYCVIFIVVCLFFPLSANAWVFGIQFNLSDDQLSKLEIHEVNIGYDRLHMIVYNRNAKVTITELTISVVGNNFKVYQNISPYTTKQISFTFSLNRRDSVLLEIIDKFNHLRTPSSIEEHGSQGVKIVAARGKR